MDARMETPACQYARPRTNGKCLRCGSEAHSLQDCARPCQQQSSRSLTCQSGLQASARITKKVRLLQLRAHLHRTLKNLFVTHGSGVVLVA